MVKPSYRTDSPSTYQKGYQQALEDFAIAPMLARLKNGSDANLEKQDLKLLQRLTGRMPVPRREEVCRLG